MTHLDILTKYMICALVNLLHESHGCSAVLHQIQSKVIQDPECEGCWREICWCRKISHAEKLLPGRICCFTFTIKDVHHKYPTDIHHWQCCCSRGVCWCGGSILVCILAFLQNSRAWLSRVTQMKSQSSLPQWALLKVCPCPFFNLMKWRELVWGVQASLAELRESMTVHASVLDRGWTASCALQNLQGGFHVQ